MLVLKFSKHSTRTLESRCKLGIAALVYICLIIGLETEVHHITNLKRMVIMLPSEKLLHSILGSFEVGLKQV